MNYAYYYFKIIVNRLENPIDKIGDGKVETHHIISLSEGGKDVPENKVNLTLREHYVVHLLLWKIYDDYKMSRAVIAFQKRPKKRRPNGLRFNSWIFRKVRLYAASFRTTSEKREVAA